jgi:hypothetical protein
MSDVTLRAGLIRLAHSRPDLRTAILPLVVDRVAMEFKTQEAYDTYLEKHPKADKSKHKVRSESGGAGGKDTGGKDTSAQGGKSKSKAPSHKEISSTLKSTETKAKVSGAVDAAVLSMKPAARKSLSNDLGYDGEKPAKSMKSFREWADGHAFGSIMASAALVGGSAAAYGALGVAIGSAAAAAFPVGLGLLLAPIGIYGAAYLYGKATGKNAPGFGEVTENTGESGVEYSYPDTTFARTATKAIDPEKLKEIMEYVLKAKPKLQKAIESGKDTGKIVADMYANLPEGGLEVLAQLGQVGPGIVDELLKGENTTARKASQHDLRAGLIRLAHSRPEFRTAILPLVTDRVAMEFTTEKALKDYLEKHPKADKSKHKVKGEGGEGGAAEGGDEGAGKPKKPKKPTGIKVNITDDQIEARRPSLSDDLKGYGADATKDDLKPEHREAIKEYNLEVVGHDAAQAVEIARKVKEGIQKGSDICKMNPPVCAGNKGLTRDKMPQIEGETPTRVMLMSDDDRAKHGDGKADDGKFEVDNDDGTKSRKSFGDLSEKKQSKMKKDWNEQRGKGKAMVQAGADPNSNKTVMQQMIDHFMKNGVKTKKSKAPVGMLKATQSEIKAEKTYGMADAYLKGKFPNIGESVVVSRDGHILDGHHRWAAMLTVDPSREMNVQVIDMDMDDLLREAQAVPGVYKANFEGAPLDEGEQKKYKSESATKFKGKGKKASFDVQASYNREVDADRTAMENGVIRLAHTHPELRPSLRSVLAHIKTDRAVRAAFTR